MYDPDRLLKLERETRRLKVVSVVTFLALLGTGIIPTTNAQSERASILRVRGLIIEDAQGRPRILIGMPIPIVAERRRKDAAYGAIFLNENGNDALAIGESPDPQVLGAIRKRIGHFTGLVINDISGDERGGFSVSESGRVSIGLDYPGREAVSMFVMPEGYAGLMMNGAPGKGGYEQIGLIVNNKSGGSLFKLANPKGAERLMIGVDGDRMKFQVADESGSLKDVTSKFRP
jgi:hypothetical protein